MPIRTRPPLVVIPALCAVLVAILVVGMPHITDFSLGLTVGILMGLSVLTLRAAPTSHR